VNILYQIQLTEQVEAIKYWAKNRLSNQILIMSQIRTKKENILKVNQVWVLGQKQD